MSSTLRQPALHAFQPRTVAQTEILMTDALTACQQRVSELLRLEVNITLNILEPLG